MRRTQEIREKMENIHDELRELDEEYEHQQGEKSQKYKELKQKEQQIDEFLATFEQIKIDDQRRINELQKNIVKLLQLISKVCIARTLRSKFENIQKLP